MHNASNIFSTITLGCAVGCLSIAPSFAQNQSKIPPRCLVKYYNCIEAYKDTGIRAKDNGVRAQCENQYNNCQKGITVR